MEIVGHSAIEMTMNVYGHVTLDNQRAALDLLSNQLSTDEGQGCALLPRPAVSTIVSSEYRSDLVGVAGFEPTAPRSQSECATKLRHTPGADGRQVYDR